MMNRTIKNILVRDLSEEDNNTIRVLMQETGCFQASKAIMKAAYSFVRSAAVIKKQAIRIKELEAENYVLRRNAFLIVEANKKLESVLMISKT